MFKNSKMILASVAVLFGLTMVVAHAQAVNTDVYLSVLGGNVTAGVSGSFNFGALPVSATPVTTGIQITGANYFWVSDMKGVDTGWYTTISTTDLTGTNGTISSGNVSIKAATGTTLITGTTNANVIVSGMVNYTVMGANVLTFMQRGSGVNLGKIGTYASYPWLQITVPAYQAVGSYHATITFTIYG